MNSRYPKISPNSLLTQARALMRDLGLRMLPVVNEDMNLVGVVRREHVLTLTSTKSDAIVANVMEEPHLVFKPEEEDVKVFKTMIEFDEWYSPVVSEVGNKYLGVISLDAFLREVIRKDTPLHEIKLSDVMSTNVEYVSPEDPVSKVWRKMVELRYSGFPVARNRDLVVVGIITQHDLLKKGYTRIELESESGPRPGPKIKEAMTSPAEVLKPYNKVRDAVSLMVKKDFGRVPIVDDSYKLVGIVDRSDLCLVYLRPR